MALPDLYNPDANNTLIEASTTRYTADGSVYLPWTFDPVSLRNPNTSLYELPVLNPPCSFAVDLPNDTYRFRFTYCDEPESTWIMDISDVSDNPLVCGIPLVTGLDLLGPHVAVGLGVRMFVVGSGTPSEVPGYSDLGNTSKLFIEVPNVT